jgi:hypothetical protein
LISWVFERVGSVGCEATGVGAGQGPERGGAITGERRAAEMGEQVAAQQGAVVSSNSSRASQA